MFAKNFRGLFTTYGDYILYMLAEFLQSSFTGLGEQSKLCS